jgi:hypothetical protein
MRIITGLGLCVLLGGCSDAPANSADDGAVADPLQGAWTITEVVTTGPEGRTQAAPQPGMAMFIDGHYSLMSVNSDGVRPRLPPYDSASVEQLVATLGPVFTANGGLYTVAGDTLVLVRRIAKNPNTMGPGAEFIDRATYRLAGDTLWVTFVSTSAGPIANPTTVKHLRAR